MMKSYSPYLLPWSVESKKNDPLLSPFSIDSADEAQTGDEGEDWYRPTPLPTHKCRAKRGSRCSKLLILACLAVSIMALALAGLYWAMENKQLVEAEKQLVAAEFENFVSK
jgi:hypothetical protein